MNSRLDHCSTIGARCVTDLHRADLGQSDGTTFEQEPIREDVRGTVNLPKEAPH